MIFFRGVESAAVFNGLADVMIKLKLVVNMHAYLNSPVTFASEDAHMIEFNYEMEPYAVEVVVMRAVEWYE